MANVPHFSFPFRRLANGKTLAVVEQDTDDEVMDCVEVFLSTEQGERVELPDYGLPDQVFREGGVDMEQVHSQIEVWEPRALLNLVRVELEDLVDRVRIEVRSNE